MFRLLNIDDAEFDDMLRRYTAGELAALPDGFGMHAVWLRWRDRNGPPANFDAKQARAVAVTYVSWCRAGLIPDETPKARVRDCYGLNSTDMVDDWCRRLPAPVVPPNPTEADSIDVQLAIVLAGAAYRDWLESNRKK